MQVVWISNKCIKNNNVKVSICNYSHFHEVILKGVQVYFCKFLVQKLGGKEWSALGSGRCTPRDKILCYPLCNRLSRQDSLSVWIRNKKIAASPANRTQVPQSNSPWSSNYTVLAKIWRRWINSKRREGFKTETKENIKE